MTTRIILIGLLLLLAACVGGVWLAQRTAAAPFIAPGATSVSIVESGLGERTITYVMPNPDDGWQTYVAHSLASNGWELTRNAFQWGGTETITNLGVYTRTRRLWFVIVDDQAELSGSRSSAQIVIHSHVRMSR